MGLFDQLAGQMLGNIGVGSHNGDSPMLEIAASLMKNQGGVSALLETLQSGGLSEQAASWVSSGENKPVDGAKLGQAIGASNVSALSNKFGIDEATLSAGLALVLPQIIDKLTPKGNIEGADDTFNKGLAMFGGFIKE